MAAPDSALARELATAAAAAGELADAARSVIQGYFRRSYAIEDKADESPVTVADREAEAAMRRLINRHFPHHGIVGEEYGAERADAEFVWVLDPIDGTKSFICGVPLFGTLISLLHRGVAKIGVIDQPISCERWLGVDGRPSTLNGAPIRTRACAAPEAATLFATAPDMFKGADKRTWCRLLCLRTACGRVLRRHRRGRFEALRLLRADSDHRRRRRSGHRLAGRACWARQ